MTQEKNTQAHLFLHLFQFYIYLKKKVQPQINVDIPVQNKITTSDGTYLILEGHCRIHS